MSCDSTCSASAVSTSITGAERAKAPIVGTVGTVAPNPPEWQQRVAELRGGTCSQVPTAVGASRQLQAGASTAS
eukprot:SAG31_NODE_14_length_37953_cov_109.719660_26_plen_74_part_00